MPSAFVMLAFSLFLVLITTHSLVQAMSVYEPTDIISLDCSSSDLGSHLDRMSNSLNDSKADFFVVSKVYTRVPTYNEKQQQACLHRKQFTYTFPISPGPKFIRLYFNPASCSHFHISRALFSVSAGPFTLLKTSNASYAAARELDSDQDTVKEYCVNVDGQLLNVTFIPSPQVPGAFAFVNKIEVVSMPSYLYIREFVPLPLIGQPSLYHINNSRALEMMHRLNIGGGSIPAKKDTGMFRQWVSDESFLTLDGSYTAILHSRVDTKSSSEVPAYVAPDSVYVSARSTAATGSNQGVNWSLPVDSGFYYLVRLHFCEISSEIHDVDQRVFHVYIKDQTAEEKADIFRWGPGANLPVYRDYIVDFSHHSGSNFLSLSIENSNGSTKKQRPAILNGLEIFKLSDFNNSLAGPFSFETKYGKPSRDYDKPRSVKDVILSQVAVFVICIFALVGFVGSTFSDSKVGRKLSQSSNHCQSFAFDQIKLATDSFSDSLLLGAGGYGKVYKGIIKGGTNVVVAIKRANPSSSQGLNEFQTEILLLSRLRHCHLVSLIGCCDEKQEMILVYDYMANGTLRDHLYNSNKPPLSWIRRLAICIGAARGLHYLHTGSKHKIIHRDVKSTNILLDKDWVAKVSDFGLSKVGPNMLSQSNTHVSTMVKGSFGYLDPEYYKRQKLTEKSDVYSFGVVLFEVLCARPAVLQVAELATGEEHEKVNLAEWVSHCYRTGRLDQIIDPYLQGKIEPTCLKTFIEIARKCLAEKGSERPTMGEVLWNLEQAWLQQESVDCLDNNGNCNVADTDSIGGVKLRNGGSDPTPGVEFSELIVTIGR